MIKLKALHSFLKNDTTQLHFQENFFSSISYSEECFYVHIHNLRRVLVIGKNDPTLVNPDIYQLGLKRI